MKSKLIATLALTATLASAAVPAVAKPFKGVHHDCVYTLANRVDRKVHFNLDGREKTLYPGQSWTFDLCRFSLHPRPNLKLWKPTHRPVVEYDMFLGRRYRVRRVRLQPGRSVFGRKGRIIFLSHFGGDGPRPNFTLNR